MDKIVLHGMDFYGYHGILPEERSLGQRYVVDLELYLDLRPAGESDDLNHTVDYAKVFELVESIITGQPYQLLEALAEAVAGVVLKSFPVKEVLVRVKKPQAPIPGKFAWMSVEIHRNQGDASKQGEGAFASSRPR